MSVVPDTVEQRFEYDTGARMVATVGQLAEAAKILGVRPSALLHCIERAVKDCAGVDSECAADIH